MAIPPRVLPTVVGGKPVGAEVDDHRTFDGVTVPRRGRGGWHHGTDRWEEGAFFRFEITDLELLA